MGDNNTQSTPMGLALPSDDIAILGFSFKLPQDVEDDAAFWDVLQQRKNLMTEWPESRLKAGSFVGNNNKNANKVLPQDEHWCLMRTKLQSRLTTVAGTLPWRPLHQR